MQRKHDTDEDDGDSAGISKTRRKQEMHELQALGERLAGLNNRQLEALALPEDLHEAVVDSRSITKHEARRRHMQFIGRLMRSVDAEPIREKLKEWDGQSKDATALQHQLERWRERLIDDEAALSEYLDAHPGVDIQHLRALIRHCRDERLHNKPPRHYRELFRELKRIAEAPAEAGDA
jgi:ribosome-associated protein